LSQHEAVKEAVVTLYAADDNKRLAAYITAEVEEKELIPDLIADLKKQLKARLPEYMVPSHFTILEKLPLTPNGKIDRKNLPEPDGQFNHGKHTSPRDTLEWKLLTLWQEVLNLETISIHDNFFDLGGHSLLAMRLISAVEQQFGVRLPVSLLFQSSTIAELSAHLRDKNAQPAWTNCVPIQTRGTALPVYLLPGGPGSVLYLQPLASSLGRERPLYALQTPGLNAEAPILESVEALAAYHVAALRRQQPQGPYQLIGHSSGGTVAFEVAYQLAQQGEDIAFLGILDTNAPNPAQRQNETENTDYHRLHDLISVFEIHTGLDLNLSLAELQATDIADAYKRTLACFQGHQIVFAPDATVAELKNWVKTFQVAVSEGSHYQNAGKVPCPIHLFRASEQTVVESDTEQSLADNRPVWGWSDCTQAKAVEIAVPGNHASMMALPHVRHLA
ncbi:MAG: non-ribosomal peptide synthetase, partial [Candidatus Electrothrix sp. EH2]|nr:non-ribosomal peptide synthetase [Candidatus Electrothrix sp. EH2]